MKYFVLSLSTLACVAFAGCNGGSDSSDSDTGDQIDDEREDSGRVYREEPVEFFEEEEVQFGPRRADIEETAVTVDMICDGPHFRADEDMAETLKSLGFVVVRLSAVDVEDEMASYSRVSATREGDGGTTVVDLKNDENLTCEIEFANPIERDLFVESMEEARHKRQGKLYSHPDNGGYRNIYAKVEGLRVVLIYPFEMLPSDF